ncbi:phospholipase D-like domain-containing protein [Sphingobacterium gobiense]|uniref:phospholipase D n=1 Tax=Sphingobacterium gobiense TaxID=1382456 RepID=A0A2S9JU75_9SPHI|nr:phospholipase D-like domain-containing protein [Sphingobacterium gobiense]PRD56813.1 hypothetical protein C5749_06200 [Sphingobacterium gobiense]
MKINFKNPFTKTLAQEHVFELDQRVINDNEAIHAAIVSSLSAASEEILIAAAWFTDEDLFDVLEKKIAEGVKIEIVMSENQENYRLPFDRLTSSGAVVIRIKNAGYGVMNQKFCVIDRSFVLHGSYNWSVNARKNNNESIIATNHQPTVDSLVASFYKIKTKVEEQTDQLGEEKSDSIDKTVIKEIRHNKSNEVEDVSFANVLDSMIAAEVSNFDRSLLRQQGFDRAKANNGDHQVIYKVLDTVYSIFINDIDVIEDKKRRLLGKVEEQKLHAIGALKRQTDLSLNHTQADIDLRKKNLEASIATNNSTIAVNDENITNIEDKIKREESIIAKYEEDIKSEKLAFVKPAHRPFELIPLIAFGILLLIYLFIFYSSAAYIMIYSASDAEMNQLEGYLQVPEVFNPDALSDAWNKGTVAFFFVITFVLVPIVLAVLPKIVGFNFWGHTLTWIGIILVDAVIAYQVASVVHQVHKLRGDTTLPWEFTNIFSDSNFYLVFILGALGLVVFKFVYTRLIGYYEERNLDHAAMKSKALIKEHEREIKKGVSNIHGFRTESSAIAQRNIILRAENQLALAEIEQSPAIYNREKERVLMVLNQKSQYIQQTSDLYVSHIENDNLPISLDSLKDRINIFLEGWNDFLHQQYSVAKATEMSFMASDSVNQWQEQKLTTQKIDRRVKF